jgi:hypothetical protein
LPAASVARTLKVWEPSANPVYCWGEEQALKAAPSREHSKVEFGSVEENVKLASLVFTIPDGPESMMVSGGVVSGATKMRALNDRGDESPEGELTDGILDQLAKFERAKTAEKTRRGRLRKVKEGKILAAHAPRYSFKFSPTRDGYEVDEEKMAVVRRMFYLVGVEGRAQRSVERMFEREGIPTPKGAKHWDRGFFRSAILDDVIGRTLLRRSRNSSHRR